VKPAERVSFRPRAPAAHVRLSVFFLLTRVVLAVLGLRMNFDIAWMFLSDPVDLRERLFDCVYYFHAYPPGMNLLTGLLLKLGGERAALLALLLFWALGLALVNALLYLLYSLGLRLRVALLVAAAFAVIPQTLYLEHLYLYEHLVAALLVVAGALLHAGVRTRDVRHYVGFFAVCALVGWFRSSFHLLWFLGMLALVLWFGRGLARRRLLVAASVPASLLLALYLKNWALFGVFATTSAAGGNLTHVTISQLSVEERTTWLAEHRVSPLAGLHVYSGPAAYLPYFPATPPPRSPVLDALERPSVGAPNYNHWVMIPAMAQRQADALEYVRERPLAYLGTALRGFRQVFGPATEWHPKNGKPGSAHYEHQQVLGGYARIYNGVVHAGPGLYALLPLPLAWALRRLVGRFRSRVRSEQARAAVLAFALAQIGYVVVTSSLFTIGESARYRHQIEALIWLVAALALAHLARWRRHQRREQRLP